MSDPNHQQLLHGIKPSEQELIRQSRHGQLQKSRKIFVKLAMRLKWLSKPVQKGL